MNLWQKFKSSAWSPYVAGILLGIACILSIWLSQKGITGGVKSVGISGGIANVTSLTVNAIAPQNNNTYFKTEQPQSPWMMVLLIGVFLGGLLAALTSKTFKIRWSEDPTWVKVFGKSRWLRFLLGFLGAAIGMYGANLAGGCTSGLAISGGLVLAPAAFIFIASMFVSGIITALLVYGRRY
jgi:hypothetical protein